MNERAVIGGNIPPDPIDEALAPYGAYIEEAEGWLDGAAVQNEAQMRVVDDLLKQIKAAEKATNTARDEATKPLHAAWQAEVTRWKPTLTDLDRLKKGLVSIVDAFKRKLAAEKAEAERLARVAAEKARREAEEAARKADASNIEAQREAAAKMEAAELAQAQADAASKDTVKGLRLTWRYEITDHRAALHDIALNDREGITAFIEEYVRRNHKDRVIPGVRSWQERTAF